MSSTRLSVVLFAYNEEGNIAPVLQELRTWLAEHEPDSEVVFVDDGSTDNTRGAAEQALAGFPSQILRHEHNRGIGAGLKTGVSASRGSWVTFLPADGQVPPAAIGQLRAAAEPGVEVVFSVYDDRDDGAHRKVLSWGVRTLIFAIHGVRMKSDGPYLFQRALFDPERLKPDTFFLNFEFPIRMLRAHREVRTVTVECRPRLSGHSKSTGLKRIFGVARDLVELRFRR